MSEAHEEQTADLQAIFGLDDDLEIGDGHVPLVTEIEEPAEEASDPPRRRAGDREDSHADKRQRDSKTKDLAGVTSPSRRGSSSRFLTDVIVDMGLASRGVVEQAIESSRSSGTTPERVLLEGGAFASAR